MTTITERLEQTQHLINESNQLIQTYHEHSAEIQTTIAASREMLAATWAELQKKTY